MDTLDETKAPPSKQAGGAGAHWTPDRPDQNAGLTDTTLPGEPHSERLRTIQQATNPLLEAARPLLRALADMPNVLDEDASKRLLLVLSQEMRMFETLCEQAKIRRDHMLGARYCLCTALDEAAMKTPWGGTKAGAQWSGNALAVAFHNDREGGVKIYLLIGRLMSEPREHLDLLEVIYRILSFGFMGRYRSEPDGARSHEAVRQRLYHEIRLGRGSPQGALSPHAHSDARGRRLAFHDFPVWITVAVLGFVVLSLCAWFKYQLLGASAAVEKQIIDIGRMTPPAAPRRANLKELLKDEIAAGTVSVTEDAKHSAVTFRGDAMFRPGGAAVNASMNPLIAKIAQEIAKVPGKVTVSGYTDNVPVRSRQYESNGTLSEERATQVMQMLQAAGVPAGRLEAIGKGEADPVGNNATAQGRAQNRRVEISVAS
ncbi:OmpA/MotB family outer membrane protein [Caballeronia pedi]|uniref:OmpA/MotB family outer membrane protein n=1 Tax=Caballeronia pedi TaxID=1777141 RepID=A0A157ZVL6_9BURK|nr:type VI secretion system protein TssL, long form [Caballeronia pedi]SAK49545.1 OmpA/MotB family outer membrane protein [Caballeronia pedi]